MFQTTNQKRFITVGPYISPNTMLSPSPPPVTETPRPMATPTVKRSETSGSKTSAPKMRGKCGTSTVSLRYNDSLLETWARWGWGWLLYTYFIMLLINVNQEIENSKHQWIVKQPPETLGFNWGWCSRWWILWGTTKCHGNGCGGQWGHRQSLMLTGIWMMCIVEKQTVL